MTFLSSLPILKPYNGQNPKLDIERESRLFLTKQALDFQKGKCFWALENQCPKNKKTRNYIE